MYKSLEAKLHDIFWQAEAPDLELSLILDHLKGSSGSCFEIGCGSGRVLLPLNEKGIRTDGNDVSQEMLDMLEVAKGDVECNTYCTPISEIDISAYQHFIVPAFTFMLMAEGEVEASLRYIHENTAEGATIYFTIFMPWAEICGELEENEWYKDHEAESADGAKASCRTSFTIDRTNQRLKRSHRYTYRPKNEVKQTYESQQELRWFTYPEMSLLLSITGWQIEKMVYDLDPEDDSENAHLYTFIAKKKN